MKKILLIAILLSAVSCVKYDIEEILLMREEISLTSKGVEQFAYDPETCQMAQNKATNQYRVFNDKLSGWFILTCNEMPLNEGQVVTADLSWTTSKSTKSMNGLNFKVEKTDRTGKIWMWCEDKSIGIVIKNL